MTNTTNLALIADAIQATWPPAVGQYTNINIIRNVSYSGGSANTTPSALRVDLTVGANVTDQEWGIIGALSNNATAGDNVGIYGQGLKNSGAGPTWAMVADAQDTSGSANPITGLIGLEVDCFANGTDSNNQRQGLQVAIGRYQGAGSAVTVGFGVIVATSISDGINALVNKAYAVSGYANYGFDTVGATVNTAAIRIAGGQFISMESTNAYQLSYQAGLLGLTYSVSGVGQVTLYNSGALGVAHYIIDGTYNTGAQVPAALTNKPGSTTGSPATWLSVHISGNQYWVPAWGN